MVDKKMFTRLFQFFDKNREKRSPRGTREGVPSGGEGNRGGRGGIGGNRQDRPGMLRDYSAFNWK